MQPFPSHEEALRVRAPFVANFSHVREFPDDWFVPATTITYSALVHADRRFSKERYVTTNDSNDNVGTRRVRSPIAAGLFSLSIYIAIYLAVAGALHVLTPSDAVAVAPNGTLAATVSKPPVDAANLPSHRSSESSADGYAMHRTE